MSSWKVKKNHFVIMFFLTSLAQYDEPDSSPAACMIHNLPSKNYVVTKYKQL